MARPMLLMKKELLMQMYFLRGEGVPVCKLIQKHDIAMTPPTLTKLLSYVDASETTCNAQVDKLIYNSLFPQWLDEAENDVVKQPSEWRYEGKMPLGKWVRNEWAEVKHA